MPWVIIELLLSRRRCHVTVWRLRWLCWYYYYYNWMQSVSVTINLFHATGPRSCPNWRGDRHGARNQTVHNSRMQQL